ncbi:hypothetical protein, partial [Veronia pacifica]|uniref:hypothetical protein n=1 Tax=Veronia pacifica TaxID=1080227 RepID=UPI0015867797
FSVAVTNVVDGSNNSVFENLNLSAATVNTTIVMMGSVRSGSPSVQIKRKSLRAGLSPIPLTSPMSPLPAASSRLNIPSPMPPGLILSSRPLP